MTSTNITPQPATTVKLGSVNFSKLMRHLRHRTNQVRDLVFVRDPIHRKSTKTTGATSDTLGAGTALSGPAVNFGYEQNSFATQSAGTDAAYHVNSPEMTIPGFTAIQSPIIKIAILGIYTISIFLSCRRYCSITTFRIYFIRIKIKWFIKCITITFRTKGYIILSIWHFKMMFLAFNRSI